MNEKKQILLKLFAYLRDYGENEQKIDFVEGMTPRDVALDFEIPLDDVAIIMVNGRRVGLDTELVETDVLALFPAVGGG